MCLLLWSSFFKRGGRCHAHLHEKGVQCDRSVLTSLASWVPRVHQTDGNVCKVGFHIGLDGGDTKDAAELACAQGV